MNYRPDIDGLRAIAVLSVVLFHVDPTWVPAGFIGVDIFFVISGFLITGIIVCEIDRGTFTFSEFYRRRLKRIAPALSLVVLTSLVVGQFILLPDDLKRLAESAVAAQFWVGNLYFTYFLDTSYFADDASLEPLLHLWSLGVEEQFYLIWPLALVLGLSQLGRPRVVSIAGVIILVSFLLGDVFAIDPMFLYYMLPSRAGELLVGALCFFFLRRVRVLPPWLNTVLAVMGVSLIALSLVWLSTEGRFPGVRAIPVSVGTGFLLLSGLRANPVSRLLALRPFVYIGLISYSMYLWHWPVLAFSKYAVVELSISQKLFSIGLIIVLSFLSYRFVEVPCRASKANLVRILKRQFVPVAATVSVVSLIFIVTSGLSFYALSPSYKQALASKTESASHLSYVCQDSRLTAKDLGNPNCILNGAPEPAVLLWGDSNASHYVPALAELAREYSFSFRNFEHGGCAPVLDRPERFAKSKWQDDCKMSAELVRTRLAKYKVIFISASWYVYLGRDKSNFEIALSKTIQSLSSQGKKIVVVGEVPTMPEFDRNCELKAMKLPFLDCDPMEQTSENPVREVNKKIRKIAEENGAAYFDFNSALCKFSMCSAYFGSKLLYYDRGHLSVSGAEALGAELRNLDFEKELFSNLPNVVSK